MIAILILAVASFADLGVLGEAPFAPVRSFAAPRPVFAAPKPAFAAPAPAFAASKSAFAAPAPAFAAPARAFAPAPAFGFAAAKPQISVVERTHLQDEQGHFVNKYSQDDGTSFQETGSYKPTNDNLDQVLVKAGSYRYVSPEGVPVEVSYTADAYGFHPISASIPVAPAAPAPGFV